MEKLHRWKCYVCGDGVIEGQKFTFTTKGPVHLHCLERVLVKKYKENPEALKTVLRLLKALDISATALVGYKQLKLAEESEDLKKFFEKLQIDEENVSTRITEEIERFL